MQKLTKENKKSTQKQDFDSKNKLDYSMSECSNDPNHMIIEDSSNMLDQKILKINKKNNNKKQLSEQTHCSQKKSYDQKKLQNNRKNNKKVLPIDEYAQDQVFVELHSHLNEEVVIVFKHTKTVFEAHKEDFYRDKGSKRNEYENMLTQRPEDNHLKNYWQKRYYLFSKFDRGILIDDESWYSVTPEPMAKYIAQKISDRISSNQDTGNQNGQANVLDAFCGVGGNLIQFSKKCGFCVGVDMDPQKIQYAKHNSQIYGLKEPEQIQFVHSDYLTLQDNLQIPQFHFPEGRKQGFDAVFLSPPWGGTGYQMLDEYTLDQIYPDFEDIITKSIEFSNNLILFLPKNTSITQLIKRLIPFHRQLVSQNQYEEEIMKKSNELVLEFEELCYGQQSKVLMVSIGQLAKINAKEVAKYFVDQYCNNYGTNCTSSINSGSCSGNESESTQYLKQIMINLFQITGYKHFIKYLKREGKSKISLQKVVKYFQIQFTPDQWCIIKKYHKGNKQKNNQNNIQFSNNASKSNLSGTNVSQEEGEKISLSGGSLKNKNKTDHQINFNKGNYFKNQLQQAIGVQKNEQQINKQNQSIGATYSHTSRTNSSFSQGSCKMEDDLSKSQNKNSEKKVTKIPHLNKGIQFSRKQSFFDEQMKNIDEEMNSSSQSDNEYQKFGGKRQNITCKSFNQNDFGDSRFKEKISEQNKEEEKFGFYNNINELKILNQTESNKINKKPNYLKELSEQNFLDLIADKNQDKRFYGWLHFHPLFDDDSCSSRQSSNDSQLGEMVRKEGFKNRRSSHHLNEHSRKNKETCSLYDNQEQYIEEQNIKKKDKNEKKKKKKNEEDEEINFFQEMYAGISFMFDDEQNQTNYHQYDQNENFIIQESQKDLQA